MANTVSQKIVGDTLKREPLGHRVRAFNAILPLIVRGTPNTKVYIHQLQQAAAPLGGKMAALVSMYDNPSPVQTQSYNDKKLIEAAGKLSQARATAFNEIQKVYKNGLLENEMKMSEKVTLKPNEYAAETRAVLRSMPKADRLSALAQLAAKNNGAELAAVINAPALLSGVTEEDQQTFRTQIFAIHAKEEIAELEELTTAYQASLDAIDVAGTLAKELTDPTRLAEINMGVDAAAAAEAAFTAPFSNVTI
jgi:hypothetical protein